MTTYKEGDLVTFSLDRDEAQLFNGGETTWFSRGEIIKHEPTPEPESEIITFLNINWGGTYEQKKFYAEFADAIIAKVKRELGK